MLAGETTPNIIDAFNIEASALDRVNFKSQTTSDGKTIITSGREYEGLTAYTEFRVDAVQEHNAQDAIWSAWGRKVTVSNGILSLD